MSKQKDPLGSTGILKLMLVAAMIVFVCAGRSDANTQTPSESALVAVLSEMYSDADGEVRYFLKWFDLNGDGAPEAIVYVVGPQACGTGGCDTHIFVRSGDRYKLVSTIGLSKPPIIASQRRSHGWRNLAVFVSGGGIQSGYYTELRFNGRRYPENPTVKPAVRINGRPGGTVLIKDYKFYTEGKSLIPPKQSQSVLRLNLQR